MKKLLFTLSTAVIMALAIVSCGEKSTGEPDGNGKGNSADILESTWDKESAKYTFLKDFPSYDYDFQGNYMEASGSDTYILADRDGSDKKLEEYKEKFRKAGFTEEKGEFETSYKKQSEKGKWHASLSYEPRVTTLTVAYMFEPKE